MVFDRVVLNNQAPPITAEPDFSMQHQLVVINQRPKKSHNRIITGIGTPSSQSKSPRPMLASLIPLPLQQRRGEANVPAKRDGTNHQ
jgi:hypothetical protein